MNGSGRFTDIEDLETRELGRHIEQVALDAEIIGRTRGIHPADLLRLGRVLEADDPDARAPLRHKGLVPDHADPLRLATRTGRPLKHQFAIGRLFKKDQPSRFGGECDAVSRNVKVRHFSGLIFLLLAYALRVGHIEDGKVLIGIDVERRGTPHEDLVPPENRGLELLAQRLGFGRIPDIEELNSHIGRQVECSLLHGHPVQPQSQWVGDWGKHLDRSGIGEIQALD